MKFEYFYQRFSSSSNPLFILNNNHTKSISSLPIKFLKKPVESNTFHLHSKRHHVINCPAFYSYSTTSEKSNGGSGIFGGLQGDDAMKRMKEKYELLDVSTRIDKLQGSKKAVEERLKETEGDFQKSISNQKDLTAVEKKLADLLELKSKFEDIQYLYEMAESEKETDMMTEVEEEVKSLEQHIDTFSLNLLMSGKMDHTGCMIELRAGSGGAESCDLVRILVRMYTRWGENKGFQVALVDFTPDSLGYKMAVLKIVGEYAYGLTKHETGVHRMVRISKIDSGGRRHTTFAAVQVYPYEDNETPDTKWIDIPARELKIEFMKSQGAGGQHVNKTESAVRLTHLPSGISVFCQNERSQHRNKATAMRMLQSRLFEREEREREKEKSEARAALPDNSWGNQIRNYVLQPYQLVKDLRSGYESSQIESVMDGEIDELSENSQ